LEIFATLLLFILIGVMIMVNVFYRQAKKVNKEQSYTRPDLGIKNNGEEFQVAMKYLIQHLEDAYPEHYPEWVKERVIREQHISMTEWDNRWFEWQHFLIMSALLKTVPMYSNEMDMIWHEMLMFTREYEQFSERFLKTTLHHAPNVVILTNSNEQPRPTDQETPQEQRAWFDLIYLLLFEPTPYSVTVLGPFLRHALSAEVISDFQTLPQNELKAKYFHNHVIKEFAFMEEVVEKLIVLIQDMLEKITSHASIHGTDIKRFRLNNSVQPTEEHPLRNHLVGTLFLAMYHREKFTEQNKKWYKANWRLEVTKKKDK
jgi:hypothetical protein